MPNRIVPNLWFDGNAEEAGEFYSSVFPNTTSKVTGRYPDSDLPDFQQAMAGKPVTVDVDFDGFPMTLINAGNEFRPTPAFSFFVNIDPLQFNGDELSATLFLDQLWERLVDGGQVMMALGEYPYSKRYGWVQDKYGVSWQVMLTDPAGEPRPRIVPCLMYFGKARAAMQRYIELIQDSKVGTVVDWPAEQGDGIMFADFQLAGQWFATMDSPEEDHSFTLTPGNSLLIGCEDQAEIDRLWDALSAVPAAEACGWLVDEFGLSWQVVPADMAAIMAAPGSYQRMISMKKLNIAELLAE